MASSSTGRWVRRVGSAGGGRTYRRRRPINYYGIIVVICVLGVCSIALARYDYRHPAGAVQQQPPTTSDTWYAALGISTCGEQHAALVPNPGAAASGAVALADGVVQVHPVTADQTGSNATLHLFVSGYPGLKVESTVLHLPPTKKGGKGTTYRSGQVCPKGTKDAGKPGQVAITYWKNLSASTSTTVDSPSSVRFSPNMLITIGFVPTGGKLPKPPSAAISAMLSASTSTTTTTLATTTTTAATTTTTTKGTTTTTHKG